MDKDKLSNICFIDGQNLHLGSKNYGFKIDYKKFRLYLKEKYNVSEAYFYLGFFLEENQNLYDNLQRAGFIVRFKEHTSLHISVKKGNVDTDMVFDVMRHLIEQADSFEKIVLVSGDGDFKRMADYLIKKKKFGKILFPNKNRRSSLYNEIGSEYYDFLDEPDLKSKIGYKK